MSLHVSLSLATALSATARIATTGALKFWNRYLRAMQESRSRKAALLIQKYRPDEALAALDPQQDAMTEPAYDWRMLKPLSESEIIFLKENSKAAE